MGWHGWHQSEGKRPSIDARRKERELFFWTVRQALGVVLLAALTAYMVVALAEGRLPDELLRAQGTGSPWLMLGG